MSSFLNRLREAALLSAVLASSAFCFAADKAGAPSLKLPDLKYEKYTLPNGLEVILREDHRLPLVSINAATVSRFIPQ